MKPPARAAWWSKSAPTAACCGANRAPACPWCAAINWEWQQVSGKGTIYSYQVVAHTVIPSFRDLTPFAIVLVELDEQRGQPSDYDGLRITGNLVDANFNMEKEEKRRYRQARRSGIPTGRGRLYAAPMAPDRRTGRRYRPGMVARSAGGIIAGNPYSGEGTPDHDAADKERPRCPCRP